MKRALILSLLFFATLSLKEKQKVALQSNGVTTIFGGATPFVTAYDSAVDGDTIYLPGVTLIPPAIIDKKLAIIGAGHYPDSTSATNKTIIPNSITIKENADSLFLTGIEFSAITFYSNHQVNNVVISRCKVNGTITYTGNAVTPCTYNTIEECVLTTVNFANATSSIITNSILSGAIIYGSGNAIYNNIFTYYVWKLQSLTNCIIANNVFTSTSYFSSGCNSCTFTYNVFGNTQSGGTNTWVNNYNNTTQAGFLVNQSGTAFDYAHDYHLTTPASYSGTDSTQVGIYGGIYPYKTAAVPLNPHISSQSIPMSTDVNGMLNININVNAQDD